MPSWNELLNELEAQTSDQAKNKWLVDKQQEALRKISDIRDNRNIIFYASAFLQKPQAPPPTIQLTHEEINSFMSVMHGMDWEKDLTLILHTPGGITNAAETIVSYLHTKFKYIEVIIPTFAMSAGTMICLATDKLIMGRQSQLGPIDPQMPLGGRTVSARAIVEQFAMAKKELSKDLKLAHLWAPILQSLGPALIQEAQNALDYSEEIVKGWLEKRMFRGNPEAKHAASQAASYFNKASVHKSHGRRIDREEARSQGICVEDLEDDQDLQEWVLTAYHLFTIVFDKSVASKLLASNFGRLWVKNLPSMPVKLRPS
jgi:hypothetical protein